MFRNAQLDRIEDLEKSVDSIFKSYSRLSERVYELEQYKKERTGEKIASMFVSPAKAPKKRGRPAKKVTTKKK